MNVIPLQIYIYIYIIYISKSWSVTFIVATLQLSHISVHVIIFYLFNFPIIVFNINFFIIFTLLQPLSLPYLFISPLPSTLISFFLFSFIFLYFCLFLFTTSYYKFVTNSSILCIVFPHKKMVLSLSLSLNFLVDFLFFLYLYVRLIIFFYFLKFYFRLMRFIYFFLFDC